MAVLSRTRWQGQQRLDGYMLLASDSFNAFDFRTIVSAMAGANQAYVLRGLTAVSKVSTSITIDVADCLIFNPQDESGSFYYGVPDAPAEIINLPANQANLFIEAKFSIDSRAATSVGYWDPLAVTGSTADGTEFTATSDIENYIKLEISSNTVGFSENSIPIMRCTTTSNAIINIIDCRNILWRLGTGGTSPDPLHKYDFSNTRGEAVGIGDDVGNAIDSPFKSLDSTGATNDKAFQSLKDWMDAVMTRISEISGSSLWYNNSSSVLPVSSISMSQLFFDALGTSLQASDNTTIKWKLSSGVYTITGEGDPSGSAPYADGLLKWKGNYNNLEWHLGNTFNSSSDRRFSNIHFESPAMADGDNLYILLEREVSKGSGATVKWADNSSYSGGTYGTANLVISGIAGDFTGIAIGDYVRKESEGYANYYKVTGYYNGAEISTAGSVAAASAVALKVSSAISAASVEPLKFFRSRYASSDLVVGQSGTYLSADYLWIGRRTGSLFMLKDYGSLQPNEEITILDGTWSQGNRGQSDIIVEKADTIQYTTAANGFTNGNNSGVILRIRRYKRDNTVPTPGAADNSDAFMEYTIDAPLTLAAGSGLWVRLNDNADGALSAGSIIDATDDLENTDTASNRWEVRTLANTPTRIYDRKDVFLIARGMSVGGKNVALFFDGTMVGDSGQYLNTSLEVKGDLKVRGSLTVEGPTNYSSVNNLLTDDKLITLGVGNLLNAGGGSGFEIADDTRTTTQADVTTGDNFIVLTYGVAHGYALTDVVGVVSTEDIGSITAGQISGSYTVVAVATAAGEAEVLSPTTLKIVTSVTSSLTESLVVDTPKSFLAPWSVQLGASDGTYSGYTSWVFKVKGQATKPTITPVSGYGIVATSNSTTMLETRVPFVNNDNSGPLGVDTTLNYSPYFSWDNTTNTLSVQNIDINGNHVWSLAPTKTANYAMGTDEYVVIPCDTSAAVADITITLPTTPVVGEIHTVKDIAGFASYTNKGIIVTPASGLIDGFLASYKIEVDYEAVQFIWNGTTWLMI